MTYNYLLSQLYSVRATLITLQGYADNLQKLEFDDAILTLDNLITHIRREGLDNEEEWWQY